MSPEVLTGIGYVIGGAVVALGTRHAWARRRNGNGHVTLPPLTPSTLQLQQREEGWRQRVDRELFDSDGMVRSRFHALANAIGTTASKVDVQETRVRALESIAQKLDEKLDEISGQIADLRVEMAEHGNHCSHCPEE